MPVFAIERMRLGRRIAHPWTPPAREKRWPSWPCSERDPEAYLTRAQAKERPAAEAVHLTRENVKRFLDHLKALQRTEKYRRSIRSYLAAWAVLTRLRHHITLVLATPPSRWWPSTGLPAPPSGLRWPSARLTGSPSSSLRGNSCLDADRLDARPDRRARVSRGGPQAALRDR